VSTRIQRRRRDFSGSHVTCTSNHSNHFATITNILNSSGHRQMSTSLGDQGSQVRVLSPRASANSDRNVIVPFAIVPLEMNKAVEF
jgi:hypothetical protein